MMPIDMSDLASRVEARCILHGDFTLSSGKQSKYFYNGKRALLAADLKIDIAAAMLARAEGIQYDIIGGVAIGSILISEPMSVLAHLRHGRPVDTFYVRSERKEWGTREDTYQAIRANGTEVVEPGARVLLVDDVITTGGSLRKALEAIDGRGAEVAAISVIVDRGDPDADWLRHSYPFLPLFEADDVGNLSVATKRATVA